MKFTKNAYERRDDDEAICDDLDRGTDFEYW